MAYCLEALTPSGPGSTRIPIRKVAIGIVQTRHRMTTSTLEDDHSNPSQECHDGGADKEEADNVEESHDC